MSKVLPLWGLIALFSNFWININCNPLPPAKIGSYTAKFLKYANIPFHIIVDDSLPDETKDFLKTDSFTGYLKHLFLHKYRILVDITVTEQTVYFRGYDDFFRQVRRNKYTMSLWVVDAQGYDENILGKMDDEGKYNIGVVGIVTVNLEVNKIPSVHTIGHESSHGFGSPHENGQVSSSLMQPSNFSIDGKVSVNAKSPSPTPELTQYIISGLLNNPYLTTNHIKQNNAYSSHQIASFDLDYYLSRDDRNQLESLSFSFLEWHDYVPFILGFFFFLIGFAISLYILIFIDSSDNNNYQNIDNNQDISGSVRQMSI